MSKVIVITGAGAGLGRALVRRFAADGEAVVLLGRTASRVEAVAAELGGSTIAIACDVASPDSVRSAFAAIAARHETIDVLINNAGVYEPFLVAEASDEQIERHVSINLLGPIYCTRSAIPLLKPGGHIINVTSESVDVGFPHLSLYQCTKAGLERFSKSMSQELDAHGIKVTFLRAGQMFEPGRDITMEPEVMMRFVQAASAAGLNLMERPFSHFDSVTPIFRALIDLPADIQVEGLLVHARKVD